jgi:plastocyanin
MTKYRSTLVGFSVALLGALALHLSASADTASSSAATPAPAATPVLVTIKDFAFSPSVVSIPVGGSVTFKNLDQAAHTATDSNKVFDSGNLDTGKSYTYTFTKAGTYKIICLYHPSMKGTIVVGSTATPPLPTPDSGY